MIEKINKNDSLVSLILEKQLIDERTLEQVICEQEKNGGSLLDVLREGNFVDKQQYGKILAAMNRLEFINLAPDMIDPMAAHMVGQDMVNQHALIPVKKEGNLLYIAMSSPLNISVRDQIELQTGCKVVPMVATMAAIRRAIRYYYNIESVTKQAIASMRLKGDAGKNDEIKHQTSGLSDRVANDPVTRLVESIITGAIDAGVSDIHIEPQEPDMRVRYRVDGLCREAITIPGSAQKEVISHIKVLADMDISEKRIPQDGHIVISHEGNEYDLRVSSLPAVAGEKIVIRILDKNADKWGLDSIVKTTRDREQFRKLISNPYGMILLTGPTGSGKTTTLYSLLQELNEPHRNIITVEDPVEYRLKGLTQVQVKPSAGMTFAKALRSILRQDPDVILIGEIRDLETAEIAISAALTGHMVLSTLHTNDAAGAVSRLINIGIPPFLVGSALLGSVAQRLIRKVCPQCGEFVNATEEEMKHFKNCGFDNNRVIKSNGCESCFDSGYQGRVGMYEIMPISSQIQGMILKGCDEQSLKQQAIDDGMKTLYHSGIEALAEGQTTFHELSRVIDMRLN